MADIVERLRDKHCCDNGCHCDEAADEIERLNDIIQNMRYAEDEDKNRCVVENERLRAALLIIDQYIFNEGRDIHYVRATVRAALAQEKA